MTTGTIIFLVLLLLGVVTAWKGIKTVPQGWVWTVERFGAFTRLLHPGLNLIIPYVDTIGRKMNVQEVVLDIPEQSVITRDNATVAVDGIVYYRVMDAAKAAYQVQDLTGALAALAMTNIRSVIGDSLRFRLCCVLPAESGKATQRVFRDYPVFLVAPPKWNGPMRTSLS